MPPLRGSARPCAQQTPLRVGLRQAMPIPADSLRADNYMYVYDEYDQRIIEERVAQFRDQTARYLAGQLSEEEFRPLRLRTASMCSAMRRCCASASPTACSPRHSCACWPSWPASTTRATRTSPRARTCQYNWIKLEDVPACSPSWPAWRCTRSRPAATASATSAADQFAGAAADEVIDPRPVVPRLVRQWASFHPEFTYLPRKFKIAVIGSAADRAAIEAPRRRPGRSATKPARLGFRVLVGGGLGLPDRRAASSTNSCPGNTC